MGEIACLFGRFLIMLIFMVIAVKKAKRKWYIVGAVLQAMSIAGNSLNENTTNPEKIVDWVIYLIILLITGIILSKKKNNNSSSL